MPLDARDKELAAIGASIGANCGPCIEHHLAAAQDAGLSVTETADAVATAREMRHEALALLDAQVDAILASQPAPTRAGVGDLPPAAPELVALGVSIGANSHSLLRRHIVGALDVGLQQHQIRSALKMAEYVQHHAAELTASEVSNALANDESAVVGAAEEASP